MKLIAPDYYNDFYCIADKCRHSCCIGWEIDIDADTLDFYLGINGNFGERLRSNIVCEDTTHHFKLAKGERCPFLNERELCDIISELGEDALCDICADHPRFRNFLSDRTELGLGLCCEAAARLILTREEKTMLCELEDDGFNDVPDLWENTLLTERSSLFDIAQNRDMPVDLRAEAILASVNTSLPDFSLSDYARIYSDLERLDPLWDNTLALLHEPKNNSADTLETAFEQLLVYFLYRHIPCANDRTELAAYTAFAVLSYKLIRAICERTSADIDTLCEIARAYSCEIEYSDENTRYLVDLLKELQ